MYYVALVEDVNPAARARIQSAYVTVYPGVYFDGGYSALLGGASADEPEDILVPWYEPEISATGQRAVPALDLVTALDWLGNNQVRVHVAIGNGVPANTAPPTPTILMGGGQVQPLQNMQFAVEGTDPEANMVSYQWDWGDGQTSAWLGPYISGASAIQPHAWSEYGDYQVKVKVRDAFGEESAWSAPVAVKVSCCAGRVGDANGQGGDEPTIGDVSVLIDVLFITGNPSVISCMEEADINQSGGAHPTAEDVTIGDVSMLIDYLFITGQSMGLPGCL